MTISGSERKMAPIMYVVDHSIQLKHADLSSYREETDSSCVSDVENKHDGDDWAWLFSWVDNSLIELGRASHVECSWCFFDMRRLKASASRWQRIPPQLFACS